MEHKNLEDSERSGKIPNQKELEKELSEYLSKKYGDRIKIMSPFVVPKGQEDPTEGDAADTETGGGVSFDMLPEELEAFLEGFIVKQSQAKAVLSTKICTHFNRIGYLQKNTGKGKTVGVGIVCQVPLPLHRQTQPTHERGKLLLQHT